MSTAWPKVPLEKLLTKADDWITIQPETTYAEVTVRLWGKGVILRRHVLGAEIKSDRRLQVRPGQFIVSRIDARNGAFGLIPRELAGGVVTNDFPVFNPNPQTLFVPFLQWLSNTSSFIEICKAASEGTTNRVRLKESRFLTTTIPLPPLEEQRRIVVRIEELATKISAARILDEDTVDAVAALTASVANQTFLKAEWSHVALGDVSDIRSGVTLGRRLAGKTVRLPYLRVANVQEGHLDLRHVKEVEVLEEERDKWQLRNGDLLLTEGGDWDKLGRGTVWENEVPHCIHQNHIFRVRTRPEDFDPYFLAAVVGSPYGKLYFQSASKQTTNLASINQRQLKAFPIPKPPLSVQRAVVSQLRRMTEKTQELRRCQGTRREELDALMPAILNKAFRGEL